jgi:phasin
MADHNQPDFPQEIRDLAIKNIGQAQTAYNQVLEAANKAQEMMKTIVPSNNPVAAGITEAQERAMRFTQQNLDAGFSMANELARAKDLQEVLQIQSRYAQMQMTAFTLQAQELGAMVTAAAQKGKQGS